MYWEYSTSAHAQSLESSPSLGLNKSTTTKSTVSPTKHQKKSWAISRNSVEHGQAWQLSNRSSVPMLSNYWRRRRSTQWTKRTEVSSQKNWRQITKSSLIATHVRYCARHARSTVVYAASVSKYTIITAPGWVLASGEGTRDILCCSCSTPVCMLW